jgi:hypothetical protein
MKDAFFVFRFLLFYLFEMLSSEDARPPMTCLGVRLGDPHLLWFTCGKGSL